MNKVRLEYIDLAKGICIILVVFHHLCATEFGSAHPFNIFVRSFRQPLFFILSGLFFKEYENFWAFLKRKINKLLIPFVCFYVFGYILNLILYPYAWREFTHKAIWGLYDEAISGNMPIWFLWCLFINNILLYLIVIISKKSKKYELLVFASLISVVGICGYCFGAAPDMQIPFFIDTALSTTPFLGMGYLLKRKTKLLEKQNWDKYLLLFSLLAFVWVFFFAGNPFFPSNNFLDCSFFSLYTCGLLGALGIIFFSKKIVRLPIISYYGRYSIMILSTHLPMYAILYNIANYCKISQSLRLHFVFFFLIMASYMIVIPLMKKYLPYITAQKDIIKISS